jgi:hypothetical protein
LIDPLPLFFGRRRKQRRGGRRWKITKRKSFSSKIKPYKLKVVDWEIIVKREEAW